MRQPPQPRQVKLFFFIFTHMGYFHYHNLYYTTFTVLGWRKILTEQNNIDVIIDSFNFVTKRNKCIIYAFVIMPNHIHVIYQTKEPYTDGKLKHSFLSHTAKKLLDNLGENKQDFLSNKSNKKYQIWKSPLLSVELTSPKFVNQKMNYIHDNPRHACLVTENGDYKYCSWKSYEKGESEFDFLKLW